ncbi:MAG: hypothetical protein ACRDAM_21345, partial [Casimicrobium sp.]
MIPAADAIKIKVMTSAGLFNAFEKNFGVGSSEALWVAYGGDVTPGVDNTTANTLTAIDVFAGMRDPTALQ